MHGCVLVLHCVSVYAADLWLRAWCSRALRYVAMACCALCFRGAVFSYPPLSIVH